MNQFTNRSFLICGAETDRDHEIKKIIGFDYKKADNNPDFLILNPEDSLGIAEVRELQKWLILKPFQNSQKIVLITSAHTLTIPAQNALLKTLEEPPAQALIILSAPLADFLLPTVVSRCQIIETGKKNQVRMAEKEKQAFTDFLNTFLSASAAEKIILLEKENISTDRQKTTAWLDKFTYSAREKLLTENNQARHQLLALIRNLTLAKKYLAANCNVRLTLETLLTSAQVVF